MDPSFLSGEDAGEAAVMIMYLYGFVDVYMEKCTVVGLGRSVDLETAASAAGELLAQDSVQCLA